MESTATTAPPGTKTELTLTQPAPNQFRLTGLIAQGDRPWEGTVAISDPALYAARVFASVLEAKGIRIMGAVATSSEALPAGLRVLAARDSPPLTEHPRGREQGEPEPSRRDPAAPRRAPKASGQGTVEAGQAAVQAFLNRLGVPSDSWGLQDGSGLSRSDLADRPGPRVPSGGDGPASPRAGLS